MNGFWRLTVRDEFSAGHAIMASGSKCERMHGHNFAVTVNVEGNQLDPTTGMLLDFAFLKKALKEILAGLDHQILNELPEFSATSPSSELIARHIAQKMGKKLAASPEAANARLTEVAVSEKGAQTASWICTS